VSFVTSAVGESKQRAVPRLKRSAATLALGRPRFDLGPAHVGYSVDGVALGRVSALLWVFLITTIIAPVLDTDHHRVLLSEGQTGKVWTPSEKQSFGYLST